MDLRNLIRVGVVSDRSTKLCAVRVVFEDQDNLVSGWLPVILPQTGSTKDFMLPDIDERVVCLFLGNGIEAGFCIGSFYAGGLPGGVSGDKRGVWFEDGSYVEFDRATGTLRVKAQGNVAVMAPAVTIDGNVTISGNLAVGGTFTHGGGGA